MKITKSQLKQIIREELNEGGFAGHSVNPGTLGHQASQKLARVGIAHESEDVRKEIMDMILALDTGNQEDVETLANMAAYLKDASSANVRQGLGLEEEKDHPGESCKQAHPDETHEEWEEDPLEISAPTRSPWDLKRRLGIGGSVHDRLGGPRHREDK